MSSSLHTLSNIAFVILWDRGQATGRGGEAEGH